jgi:hypothetical protein
MPTYNLMTTTSVEELRKMMADAWQNYDPLEELLRLERQLAGFEQQFNIPSQEFFARYEQGQVGDDVEMVRWAGRYRLYLRLKETISKSLELVLHQPVAAA